MTAMHPCLPLFRLVAGLFCGLAICMIHYDASAQPPGRDRGGFGGGRGGPGGGRGNMMGRMDRNGDGLIQPDEVPDFARPFIQRAAERAGLDPKKPIPIDRLQPSEGRGQEGGDRSRGDRGDRGDTRSRDDRGGRGRGGGDRGRDEQRKTYTPDSELDQVRGFGEEPLFSPVPGFDVPLSVTASGGLSDAELDAMYGSRVTGYVDRDMLGRYDKNENGLLDPDEWQGVRWSNDPNESDTNNDGRLTRAELIVRIAKRWDVKPRQVKTNKTAPSQSVAKKDSSKSVKVSRSTDSREKKSDTEKFREYARSIIRQYDKNKDGVLQKNERLEMRGPAVGADKNGDGNITQDEIARHLADQSKSKSSNTKTPSTRSSRSTSNGANHGMLRLRTPHERLPDGLPDWFRDRDRDLDGQVAMYEYATSWSDSTVAKFINYDVNGDGLITPEECLKRD